MPEFGGFGRDVWGIFGGHLDEFWRKIVGNLEEIKRRLEVKNRVLKNIVKTILIFKHPL